MASVHHTLDCTSTLHAPAPWPALRTWSQSLVSLLGCYHCWSPWYGSRLEIHCFLYVSVEKVGRGVSVFIDRYDQLITCLCVYICTCMDGILIFNANVYTDHTFFTCDVMELNYRFIYMTCIYKHQGSHIMNSFSLVGGYHQWRQESDGALVTRY